MRDEATQRGGAVEIELAADFQMNRKRAKLYVITPTTDAVRGILPKATGRITGGDPMFYVINLGGTGNWDIDIVDTDEDLVVTVPDSECATILLRNADDDAGVWDAHLNTVGSVTNPSSDERFYSFGGQGNSPSQMDDVYELDTQLKVWALKTAAPDNHVYGAAGVVNARGYLIGSNQSADQLKCNEYDPDAWVNKTDRSDGSWWHGCSDADGNVYCFGGNQSGDKELTDEYDVTGNSWSFGTNVPYSVNGCSAGTVSEKIYLTGGSSHSTTPRSDACYQYDPDTWTIQTSIPWPERGIHSTMALNDLIYITCGWDATSSLDDTTSFDPGTNSWTSRQDHAFGAQQWQQASSVNDVGIWLEGKATGTQTTYDYDYGENEWTDFNADKTARPHYRNNQQTAGIAY